MDQALCFGWIDSVRRSLGEDAYANRFTPRKATSTWSAINIKRAQELIDQGLMSPLPMIAADYGGIVKGYVNRVGEFVIVTTDELEGVAPDGQGSAQKAP